MRESTLTGYPPRRLLASEPDLVAIAGLPYLARMLRNVCATSTHCGQYHSYGALELSPSDPDADRSSKDRMPIERATAPHQYVSSISSCKITRVYRDGRQNATVQFSPASSVNAICSVRWVPRQGPAQRLLRLY